MPYAYILPQKVVWRDPHGDLVMHEPKPGEAIMAQLPEDDGSPRSGVVKTVNRREDGHFEITVDWR
jgi:hypothetical protein